MNKADATILVTGAAGFIGGHLARVLHAREGVKLILSDEFDSPNKYPNWSGINDVLRIPREQLIEQLNGGVFQPDWIIHLGARTDTTEFDYSIHEKLNLNYSKSIWDYCSREQVPLIYASSAATYGGGEIGYTDDESKLSLLRPLNPYGLSKHQFDLWAKEQDIHPPHWFGLKFFNVYGYREDHKGRMASMIYHGYHQIKETGRVRLFKSHRADYRDGEQRRDFIYVKDIVRVIDWLMSDPPSSGIYNLGTGKARTFNDLIVAVFAAMNLPPNIEYIDMPADLQNSYQYFTEASMRKLREAGYPYDFYTLEQGVTDYVQQHLMGERED